MAERLTPQDRRSRDRRRALKQIGAGLAMTGGAVTAQEAIGRKVGVRNLAEVARDISHGGIKPKHGKFTAGWLATRGVAAAGAPLAAVGARNLVAGRQRHDLDLHRDVVQGSIRHTIAIPTGHKALTPQERRAQRTATLAGFGASTGGGLAGAAAARRLLRRKPAAAIGLGTAVGAAGGLLAATVPTRHLTRRASGGQYDYSLERGPVKVAKLQPGDPAIQTLAQREQKELIRRKRKQSKYSLAGAGLGLTALGLRSPQLARAVTRRAPKAANAPVLGRIVRMEPKATSASNNLGVVSIGVGSAGSLNFARIQRSETKADERSAKLRKADLGQRHYEHASNAELAKALIRIKPVRFAGVKPGGVAMRWTKTGLRPVAYRGSLG